MIIENVNGEAKRVFLFGKNNEFKCYAPVEVGSGYRRRIEVAKAANAVSDGSLQKVISRLSGQKKPNGLPDKQWQQQIKDQALAEITAEITEKMNNGEIDDKLPVLLVLLTSASNVSVEKIYLEHATDEQVEAVVNFSNGLVNSKTSTEPLPTIHGKGTKSGAKAARSRNTSRPRSEG